MADSQVSAGARGRAVTLPAAAIWGGCVLAISLLLSLAFQQSLVALWHNWGRPQYSHGPFIPVIALLLLWHDLAAARPRPVAHWSGLVPIAAGYALLALGTASTFNGLALYGLVAVLAGLILAFLGPRCLKLAVPALIYLCFAIPAPDFLYVDISTGLQLLASSLAVHALDSLGLAVAQDGNIIDLGLYKLQVAEACSGLRYLFPLTSFSFLAAYMLRDRMWKRLLLFASSVPLAVILNVARIVLVGLTVDQWGIAAAEGFLHLFEGWVVFLACSGLLLVEAWALRRFHRLPGSSFRLDYFSWPGGPVFSGAPALRPACLAALALLLGLTTCALALQARMDRPPAGLASMDAAAGMPLAFGSWQGQRKTLTPDVLDALELTDYFLANFREGRDAAVVEFYVAYYRQQAIGSAIHSPSNCIPGGGWVVASQSVARVPVGTAGAKIAVNRMRIRRDGAERLVYYWFAQRGHDLTDEWSVKWYLLKDQLTTGRSDGYLVRIVTGIDGGDEAAAERRLGRMLTAAQPFLPS